MNQILYKEENEDTTKNIDNIDSLLHVESDLSNDLTKLMMSVVSLVSFDISEDEDLLLAFSKMFEFFDMRNDDDKFYKYFPTSTFPKLINILSQNENSQIQSFAASVLRAIFKNAPKSDLITINIPNYLEIVSNVLSLTHNSWTYFCLLSTIIELKTKNIENEEICAFISPDFVINLLFPRLSQLTEMGESIEDTITLAFIISQFLLELHNETYDYINDLITAILNDIDLLTNLKENPPKLWISQFFLLLFDTIESHKLDFDYSSFFQLPFYNLFIIWSHEGNEIALRLCGLILFHQKNPDLFEASIFLRHITNSTKESLFITAVDLETDLLIKNPFHMRSFFIDGYASKIIGIFPYLSFSRKKSIIHLFANICSCGFNPETLYKIGVVNMMIDVLDPFEPDLSKSILDSISYLLSNQNIQSHIYDIINQSEYLSLIEECSNSDNSELAEIANSLLSDLKNVTNTPEVEQ